MFKHISHMMDRGKRTSNIAQTLLLLACLIYPLLFHISASGGTLRTWNAPAGVQRSTDFSVRVRQDDGEWKPLFVHHLKVNHQDNGGPFPSSMVHFDFDGTVTMKVTSAEPVNSYEFRPASFGIQATKEGNTLTFSLSQNSKFPRKFVLRINDSWNKQVLHILTNPPLPSVPDPGEVDHYFGPGEIHRIGTLDLSNTNGTTVYVAGGAVLRGQIQLNGARNTRIYGRGILDGGTIRSEYGATNVRLQGLTLINTTEWAVVFHNQSDGVTSGPRNVTISKLSIITHGVRGERSTPDGIHLDASENCTAKNCFVRASDDLLNVDARYDRRDVHNVRFENMVLWCDRGHSMVTGYKGSPEARETITGVTFRNIDVINQYTGAVMEIFAADNLTIRNVTYEDIRIMPFQRPSNTKLFEIDMRRNHWAERSSGLAVRNVTYRNIDYGGAGEQPGTFIGKGPRRTIDGIQFIDYRRTGPPVDRMNEANIETNEFVHNVRMLQSNNGSPPAAERDLAFDFSVPRHLLEAVPYSTALRSWTSPNVNFDVPATVRAGEPYHLSSVRSLDGHVTAGTLYYRKKRGGETAFSSRSLVPAGQERWRGTIPPEQTDRPFEYYLELTRENGETVREPKDSGTVRITPDRAPPSSVKKLRVTRNDAAGFTIRWDPANDDGQIAGYDIYRSAPDHSTTKQFELPARSTVYSSDDVRPGNSIRVGVGAVDEAGRTGAVRHLKFPIPGDRKPLPEPDQLLSVLEFVRASTGWNTVERNQNADYHALRLNGKTYEKGLGVHSRSEIVVNLKPEYRRFVALVGIDDQKGDAGSIVTQVFVDGKLMDQSPLLKGGQKPWPVNVLLPRDSRRLRLEVDDGYNSIKNDLTNWVRAGFVTD